MQLSDDSFDASGTGETQIPRGARSEVVDDIGLRAFLPPSQKRDIAALCPQRVIGGLDLESKTTVRQEVRAVVVKEDFQNVLRHLHVFGIQSEIGFLAGELFKNSGKFLAGS